MNYNQNPITKQNFFTNLFGSKENRNSDNHNTAPRVRHANEQAKQQDQQYLTNNSFKAGLVQEDDREYHWVEKKE